MRRITRSLILAFRTSQTAGRTLAVAAALVLGGLLLLASSPARAQSPETIILISGNGVVGTLDPLNQRSLDGGATWQPALIVAKHSAYSLILGTKYISCGETTTDPADPCAIGTNASPKTIRFRAPFSLPLGFSNPSLSVDLHADNAAAVFLNGTPIGQQPCFGLPSFPGCPQSNFLNPPETFSTSSPALFQAGTNYLEIRLYDHGGVAGLDYKATVSFVQKCAGVVCTASDQCHVAGVCDPSTGLCSNPVTANGTACSDGNACTQTDTCQAGTCTGSNPVVCTALDQCHVAGTCSPSTGQCSNPNAPDGTACRASAGVCDVAETCSAGICPADSFQPSSLVCRASAGACDVAESCTGVSASCPADAKSTAECRASAGACDVAESCDGSNNNCPADAFVAGTECRASAGACDVAEKCDGTSAACPTDAFASATTVCRPATDRCDVEESCTGAGADCPPDVSAVAGTICLDHFKCYDAETVRRTAKFEPRDVLLADQFETKLMRVMKPVNVCNPADKNGEGIIDPTGHLTCYQIKDASKPKQPKFVRHNVVVENQFGLLTLRVSKPRSLCVPSEKGHVDSDLDFDHFKCHGAKVVKGTPEFQPREVILADQFETKLTRLTKPVSMCNPVDKNGEGIRDPAAHLTCYKIKDVETKPKQPNFEKRNVVVSNQFGDLTLAVLKADTLCVPSAKTDLGPVSRVDDDDDEEEHDD